MTTLPPPRPAAGSPAVARSPKRAVRLRDRTPGRLSLRCETPLIPRRAFALQHGVDDSAPLGACRPGSREVPPLAHGAHAVFHRRVEREQVVVAMCRGDEEQ